MFLSVKIHELQVSDSVQKYLRLSEVSRTVLSFGSIISELSSINGNKNSKWKFIIDSMISAASSNKKTTTSAKMVLVWNAYMNLFSGLPGIALVMKN